MRITAKRNPERARRDAQNYLDSTDWYIIRQVEEGTKVPPEVKRNRAQARNTLRKEN